LKLGARAKKKEKKELERWAHDNVCRRNTRREMSRRGGGYRGKGAQLERGKKLESRAPLRDVLKHNAPAKSAVQKKARSTKKGERDTGQENWSGECVSNSGKGEKKRRRDARKGEERTGGKDSLRKEHPPGVREHCRKKIQEEVFLAVLG